MPAAAVIPAPIAYIKVVAVETLVVGCFVPAVCPFTGRSTRCQSLCGLLLGALWRGAAFSRLCRACHLFGACGTRGDYFEKIRVFKAGSFCLNRLAWNSGIGLWFLFCWFWGRSND